MPKVTIFDQSLTKTLIHSILNGIQYSGTPCKTIFSTASSYIYISQTMQYCTVQVLTVVSDFFLYVSFLQNQGHRKMSCISISMWINYNKLSNSNLHYLADMSSPAKYCSHHSRFLFKHISWILISHFYFWTDVNFMKLWKKFGIGNFVFLRLAWK